MQNTVSTRITELRRNAGSPTQKSVAKAVGCAYRSYQNWEEGAVVPSHKNAAGLARYFGTTVEYILYGIDGDTLDRAGMADLTARVDAIAELLIELTGKKITYPPPPPRVRRGRRLPAPAARQRLPLFGPDGDRLLAAQEALL